MPPPPNLTTRAHRSWRLLVKELSAFGIVGGFCFVLDLGLFQLLYVGAGMGAVVSKLIATLVSMTVAYVGHRYWSFSHRARSGVRREYTIFFGVNGATMALGLAAVAVARYGLGQEGALVLQAVNVGSITVGTLIRFTAYRRWVFVAEDAPAAIAHREHLARRTAAAGRESLEV
jgi:putative flippase GtrA